MPVPTAKDLILTVRDSSGNSFIQNIVADDAVGFVGFDGTGNVGLQQVKDEDIHSSASISLSKLQNVGASNRVLGRVSVGDGPIEVLNPDDIITIVNAGTTQVNLARIATIANNTILGNNSGSTGIPIALTAAQTRTVLSTVQSIFSKDTSVSDLGTITTTQTIDITSGGTPALLVVNATLSTTDVTFNFTNLTSGNKGMQIVLNITCPNPAKNVTLQKDGVTTAIKTAGFSTTVATNTSGIDSFGMLWTGATLIINKQNYA